MKVYLWGVPFPSNIEKSSYDSSSGRLHFRVYPGSVARGSNKGDDMESAPGSRDRASISGYHSSVKPPGERVADDSSLSFPGVHKGRSDEIACVGEEFFLPIISWRCDEKNAGSSDCPMYPIC